MKAYYFGCWGAIGHYLFTPEGRHWISGPGPIPFPRERLDSGFCPKGPQEQGRAKVTQEGEWTVLAFWDRSVDTRKGSHSTFIFEGLHNFQGCVWLAQDVFPEVWARYNFTITHEA